MAQHNLENDFGVEEGEMITRSAGFVSELEDQNESWKENAE